MPVKTNRSQPLISIIVFTCYIDYPQRFLYRNNFRFQVHILVDYPNYQLQRIHNVYNRSGQNQNNYQRNGHIYHQWRHYDIGIFLRRYTANFLNLQKFPNDYKFEKFAKLNRGKFPDKNKTCINLRNSMG